VTKHTVEAGALSMPGGSCWRMDAANIDEAIPKPHRLVLTIGMIMLRQPQWSALPVQATQLSSPKACRMLTSVQMLSSQSPIGLGIDKPNRAVWGKRRQTQAATAYRGGPKWTRGSSATRGAGNGPD
jgi:hypothetical protein